ncbi:MAG: geranylgeranylglyceryl/heptaprenylglyceryl phosphate synthase, partial [Cytophagales bacterium]
DPDNIEKADCVKLVRNAVENKIDFLFVGGSLITQNNLSGILKVIKNECEIPVILFPGSNLHIDSQADALFFLSLISGRNPDLLIGQHVIAAPILKRTSLEILPTGYMLVDGGRPTTVSYVSNTYPLPSDKPTIAACTAMAGEMLGMKLIYMDAGSGAIKPISQKMIGQVKRSISIPLIVGGGITSPDLAADAWHAGADVVVVGNGIEDNPNLLFFLSEKVQELNE